MKVVADSFKADVLSCRLFGLMFALSISSIYGRNGSKILNPKKCHKKFPPSPAERM